MKPRLIGVAGLLQGATFTLNEAEVSIGRDPSNRLCVGDFSVSRRHCVIRREDEQFKLCDLESANGTLVNGVPIGERVLINGDLIALGDSLFLFLLHEDEASSALRPVQLEEGGLLTGPTVTIPAEEGLYHHPEMLLAALPAAARLTRDLNALLKIGARINSIRELEPLQRQLLKWIFEVVPAERGAILLAGNDLEGFASVFGRCRRPDSDQPVSVSRTVVRRVFEEGVAVLSNVVSESEGLGTAQSLVAARVHSLLAVPLIVFEKVCGVIYLDASDPAVVFDEEHLRLLTAIAGMTAVAIENVGHLEWLEGETRRLRAEIDLEHEMVGESARMREVYQLIARVAPTDSTVLIRGESGTGKELAARAVHRNSPRAGKPFVAINCAALTETLLESELFGHEKGAFTGAVAQKKGKLEVAEGGTVFLDEVGELAPPLQAKLLRVLQEREFERVGGTRPLRADIRVIAATDKDLEGAIKGGGFRPELFYRLNVVSLTLPPLRGRSEDIPLLTNYFVAKYVRKCKRRVRGVSAEARACLQSYEWPGNVRELENAIERAVVLGAADYVLAEDLPEAVLEAASPAGARVTKYYETIKETKKQLVLKALEHAGCNYAEAARLLGMHANNLHRLIRNLNLKPMIKQ